MNDLTIIAIMPLNNVGKVQLRCLIYCFHCSAANCGCTKKKSKNKKREEKAEENNGDQNKLEGLINGNEVDPYGNLTIKGIRAAMEVFSMQQKPAKTPEEALTKSYQFWNTQPVPKMGMVEFYSSNS